MDAITGSRTRVGAVYTDMWWRSLAGRAVYHVSPEVFPGGLLDPDEIFYQAYRIGIQTVLVDRVWIEKAGRFNESLPSFEDMNFLVRLTMICPCLCIRKPLVNYNESAHSVSKGVRDEFVARACLLATHRTGLRHAWRFRCRERLAILLGLHGGLAGFLSRGSRRPLREWIVSRESPYQQRLQNAWILWISRWMAEWPARLWKFLSKGKMCDTCDEIVVLAPLNANRAKRTVLLQTGTACKRIRTFIGTGRRGRRKPRLQETRLSQEDFGGPVDLDIIRHPRDSRPSTITEIKRLYQLTGAASQVVVVTDEFHTRRVGMVVARVFGSQAGNVCIVGARDLRMHAGNWWHSWAGIKVFCGELVKVCYYGGILPYACRAPDP